MDPLVIDGEALAMVLAHARETHPEECCGAIIGRAGAADLVLRFTNIQNRLHAEDPLGHPRDARTAYTPEPAELFAALRTAEQPGARLVAFYHSHPVIGAYFSAEDRARAMFGDEPAYPEASWLVVSDARIAGEARAFRWDPTTGDFLEQPILLREETTGT